MRDLILVSGYYGFDNLGDEAILEQLVSELKRLVSPSRIVVLSADPAGTRRRYGIGAASRWDLSAIIALMTRARLFVSGGGGLFQDTRSAGSVVFYAGQILLARALGAPAVIYAQGVGPLRRTISRVLSRAAFRLCSAISVRDDASRLTLSGWGIKAKRTADPVWALAPSPLPEAVRRRLEIWPGGRPPLVGISLRQTGQFTYGHVEALDEALAHCLPGQAQLVMFPLQRAQDDQPLSELAALWHRRGRETIMLDPQELEKPSQWLSLMAELDFLVAMRLHALIMSLKQGTPVVGIAYDPKVSALLREFEQPILNLAKEVEKEQWTEVIGAAYSSRDALARRAVRAAESAKDLACQNFNLLARILGMQSDPEPRH
jgi:polysaccharide pyruvyl transferase CsaB